MTRRAKGTGGEVTQGDEEGKGVRSSHHRVTRVTAGDARQVTREGQEGPETCLIEPRVPRERGGLGFKLAGERYGDEVNLDVARSRAQFVRHVICSSAEPNGGALFQRTGQLSSNLADSGSVFRRLPEANHATLWRFSTVVAGLFLMTSSWITWPGLLPSEAVPVICVERVIHTVN